MQLVAELAVAAGNRFGALPVTLLVVVFPAIFDQLGPDLFNLAGEIIDFLPHGGRIERNNNRAFTTP